jgi:PAS domain S-box-containing protein
MSSPNPWPEGLEKLHEEGGLTLYRGATGADGASVLTVAVTASMVDEGRRRLEREFAQRDLLDAQWSARPIALVTQGQRPALLLADPGGQLLSDRIRGPWEPAEFLRTAIGIAAALGSAHFAGLIHKDLKPGNILMDAESGKAWLTGFAVASRQPREQVTGSPDVIEGTLAYIAPEQTGRMNRPVDSRSDLYALGVVYYQMLSGELPFQASDPLEWIHRHVAHQPQPLCERQPSVPDAISAIVMKLLAKTPEGRYQTAGQLEEDLRSCLDELESQGRIGRARPDPSKVSGRLKMPEKLHGRQADVASLIAAFERVAARGMPEVTLVSGYSGIGKSSVVDALRDQIELVRGIFASGKFDFRQRDMPYSTVADPFRTLLRQILAGDAAELASWKRSIGKAVGVQGGLLFELLPELKVLIGSQRPLPEVGGAEAALRFRSVFQRLVCAFARPGRPLVIFLDDLQWLDPATLALIEYLVVHPDTRHLHFIGAYRDNEVAANDPLMSTIASIRGHGATVGRLALGPLDIGDFTALVADALRVDPSRARSLAKLVHGKTGGNPFFAGQFLASLEEEGLLRFDAVSGDWAWNESRIGAKGSTDNLVDLMVHRLERLPSPTQEVLKMLSCLGSRADFQTLALLAPSDRWMHRQFLAAVHAGVILADDTTYRFLHDRVREASYALIPAGGHGEMHLQIGKTLTEGLPAEQAAERIFDIANQMNAGGAALSDRSDRILVAELNLQAGRKAKASTAYAAACGYFASGLEALGNDEGDHHHELSFALRRERAESEISCANLDCADALIDELLSRSRSDIDRAQAIVLRMTLQMMRGDLNLLVRSAIEGLRMLGYEFSEQPSASQVQTEYENMREAMGGRPIESLAHLPFMDDPELTASMNIMLQCARASFFTDMALSRTLVCRLVKLTVLHGISESTVYGCAGLSIWLGPALYLFEDANRFARVALAVVEKGGYLAWRAGAYLTMQMSILWTRPVSEALACLDVSIAAAKEAGALLHACYGIQQRIHDRMFRGDPFDEIWPECVVGLSFAKRSKVKRIVETMTCTLAFVHAMRGRTEDGTVIDELSLDASLRASADPLVNCLNWILLMRRHFLIGSAAASLECVAEATPLLWSVQCHIQSVDFRVFQSLAMAELYSAANPARQSEFRELMQANLSFLSRLTDSYAPTFFHKHALVAAEYARIEGRDLEALSLYEQSIKSASDNGFTPDAALASERAGRFCFSLGLESAGRAHLREAREGYLRWGADAKVALLDDQFPGIDRPVIRARSATIETSVEQLDLAAIVKVSQALSSEIVTGRLIDRLMVIAIEHAAAERGLLILQRGDERRLEALAMSSGGGITVRRVGRAVTPMDLPETVLDHVARQGQCIILDDASVPNAFSHDEYIRQKAPRSVLCLPLRKQGDLVGVLYLENNLASHVFTPARQTVLDLLSSQAAISLHNAELYARLEEENTERRLSEAALRRSEERYALAVDAATDGHGEYLADEGLFYSSPRMLEQWGLPPELAVVPRERMLDLFPFHPDDRERAVALLDKHRDSDTKRLEFDARVFRRGEVRWMHCTTLYVRDATNKLLRASVATTDVTERMRAEEELRQSEERYALALAGSNEGVFDWDLQTGRSYMPARTQELLGIPVGDPWRTRAEWASLVTLHPDDHERREAALNAHFAGRTPMFDQEVRYILPGGRIRWFRGRGTALRDADGTAYRFVGSLGDITERKHQQEEMARLESRLQQAERFEAMGALAGGIAHDFNNILGAILGFGERALRSVEEGTRLHRDLNNVMVAGERGRTLVDRILSFSRGTAGERVPVHVEKVVREALNLLQAKLPAHVKLSGCLRAGRAAILGDAVQMHQLLMNLGTNAAQAMPQAGTLTVSLEAGDVVRERQVKMGIVTVGAWIVLQVADEGTGMTPEVVERIFDPFFTTKEVGVGTGLGLSLVLRIVTQAGGAIDVQSTPGAGSVFTVYLPRAGDALEELADAGSAPPRGDGQRVMVVDDEESLLEITTHALRELGYEAAGYGSARAALEAFRTNPDGFDVLVTDLRMPGMPGDALIREVRQLRPLLPVILVSGYVGDTAAAPSNSGWADEVLTKPLRPNALATSLARLLDTE